MIHPDEVIIGGGPGQAAELLAEANRLDGEPKLAGPHAEALLAQMRRQLMARVHDRAAEANIRNKVRSVKDSWRRQ